jgi:Flp pilus assembly pilin Flp
MRITTELVSRLVREENGQDLIEYGLLGATIGIVGALLFPRILTGIQSFFQRWGTDVNGMWTPSPPAP